jgi:hypothetical protein
VVVAIADEHAFFGTKSEFACIIGTKEGPASTTKGFEKIIVGFSFVS